MVPIAHVTCIDSVTICLHFSLDCLLFVSHAGFAAIFSFRDRHEGGGSKTDGVPAQVAAQTKTILAYAANIDNLDTIMPVVERIAHKHVSREVTAPQCKLLYRNWYSRQGGIVYFLSLTSILIVLIRLCTRCF